MHGKDKVNIRFRNYNNLSSSSRELADLLTEAAGMLEVAPKGELDERRA